jgi:hypothetical protein
MGAYILAGENKEILVCGDICIDWFQWKNKKKDKGQNWQLYDGYNYRAKPGGALLIKEMLQSMPTSKVYSVEPGKIEEISASTVLHSNIRLREYSQINNKKTYRVSETFGFTGPEKENCKPLNQKDITGNADIVIIDDAGNGFRESKECWPFIISSKSSKPLFIYKMHKPLFRGPLWEETVNNHSDNLMVIIDAGDLRSEGISISTGLSWERTALEFIRDYCDRKIKVLDAFRSCKYVMVRFGLEGVLFFDGKNENTSFKLVFSKSLAENELKETISGSMYGLSSAFIAALTDCIIKSGYESINDKDMVNAIKSGISAAQSLYKNGLESNGCGPVFSFKEQLNKNEADSLADVEIPLFDSITEDILSSWSFLKDTEDIKNKNIEEIAYDTLLSGENEATTNVPIGQFGNLKTVDRCEIESFRGIKTLMMNYLSTETTKPVSIAVFGSPGSGKSFGVKEIAKTIGQGKIKVIEFNMSQFDDLDDLIYAFHEIRDTLLSGKIPLVFFDEFDSSLNGAKYGWLKYFLAPMQDGKYKEGEGMHPIGKAIFIFAGGIFTSFKEFSDQINENPDIFKEAKGPDFISRLKGYINILGPNQVDSKDIMFIIRRAMLIRSMLLRKNKSLFTTSVKKLNIEDGVLKALLFVPEYNHGNRSIEAIIDTSYLAGKTSWQAAYLPPKEQLEIHTDAKVFMQYALGKAKLGFSRELVARSLHENYRQLELIKFKDGKREEPESDPAMREWFHLSDTFKNANRNQADRLSEILNKLGYRMKIVVGKRVINDAISENLIEELAKEEHNNWVEERKKDGWTYADIEKKDESKKLHPLMKLWDELDKDDKDKDRDPIRNIPIVLQNNNIEMEKIKK